MTYLFFHIVVWKNDRLKSSSNHSFSFSSIPIPSCCCMKLAIHM
uniref:Uncharacterized protein n=1 Tax=Arundo donax TaxID=35708 RepID=A0A0A8Y2S2_ARUDO